MSVLHARTCDLADALAFMDARATADEPFSGSARWIRAALRTLDGESAVPIAFTNDSGERVAATVFERVHTDWRSGSPGREALRWPRAEFGYHFAPRADGEPAVDWLTPLAGLFPETHLELRRTHPAAASSGNPGAATWWTETRDGRDAWEAQLKGDHRRDLRYYRRRIAKANGSFEDFVPGDDPAAFLTDCFEMHRRRIADKGQSSAYLTLEGRTFLSALVEDEPQNARMTRLRIDGCVRGTCLSFVHHGHYLCFMPGWDPTCRNLDLGRQLIYHQLLEEFDRGLCSIDLLGGDLPYKREFGLSPQPTIDLVVRPSRSAALREGVVTSALGIYRRISR